ncbi:hypothetical protein D5F01_LYC20551 [Larimichthys crocea]|uniref:Uncharacterized protein n=1 Tax=Larimichthys crocea TaxID=215358 RepID=A0A6G0HR65_LARCR|nr:hypothetical protein D5F01_LYC20551 [Larimichthys crocea]
MSNDVAHSRSTSTSDKDVERNGLYCAAAVGQTLQQDSSKGSNENVTLTPKSREMSHCATSTSKEHSTEYPQIMEKVAATCTKNEDKSPVVLTEVSETDLAKLIEYQPSSSLNCSSSQEEPTPVRLNIVKSLDDIEQTSGVSWALKHTREREKEDTGHFVKMVGMDNVQDGDEIDDQMDDDWIVIPISMYDLKFEREDEECDSQERVVLDNGETGDKETESDTDTSPLPASVPSQMEMERKINSRKEVESRTTNLDSSREARPGHSQYDRAPRRRHNSHETVTPLMKKAKCDAVEWTKAINREDPKKRKSFSVGDNYKWSEKATKGSYKSGRK